MVKTYQSIITYIYTYILSPAQHSTVKPETPIDYAALEHERVSCNLEIHFKNPLMVLP